jgi:uncharacterized RDD family membrane protein YckC
MSDLPEYPASQPPPPYPQSSADYQLRQPAYQVPVAPDGRPLAGPGQRFVARLVDSGIFLVAVAVVAGVIVGGLVALLAATSDDAPVTPAVVAIAIVLLLIVLQYVYEVEIPLRWNGQTPGKRVMKIAVIAMEPNTPLSRGKLAYRFALLFLFNLLANCYVGLLDPLWCLWDKPYRQCLHDKPPKTVVIRLTPPGY